MPKAVNVYSFGVRPKVKAKAKISKAAVLAPAIVLVKKKAMVSTMKEDAPGSLTPPSVPRDRRAIGKVPEIADLSSVPLVKPRRRAAVRVEAAELEKKPRSHHKAKEPAEPKKKAKKKGA
jgi:hypothetical protein